jgi:hypothetical protein
MADALEEPLPAEIASTGIWRIDPLESNDGKVTFGLAYPAAGNNCSGAFSLATLGLTADALAGPRHPLRFELRREAGTFVCEGTAEDGRGNGEFRFQADPAYANAVGETDIPFTFRDQIAAGIFDVSQAFVKATAAMGLPHVTFRQLLSLKIFSITPEDASALHANFPSGSLDDIVVLGMMCVTPAYVEALRRADVRGLSVSNVFALRAAGVDQAFIENLAEAGRHGLSIDEVARLYRAQS